MASLRRLLFGAHHTRHIPAVAKLGTWQSSTTNFREIKSRLRLINRPSCDFRICVDTNVVHTVMIRRRSPDRQWILRHQISVVLTCPAIRTLVTGRDHQLGWSLRYIAYSAWSRFTVVIGCTSTIFAALRAILNTVQPAGIHAGLSVVLWA